MFFVTVFCLIIQVIHASPSFEYLVDTLHQIERFLVTFIAFIAIDMLFDFLVFYFKRVRLEDSLRISTLEARVAFLENLAQVNTLKLTSC